MQVTSCCLCFTYFHTAFFLYACYTLYAILFIYRIKSKHNFHFLPVLKEKSSSFHLIMQFSFQKIQILHSDNVPPLDLYKLFAQFPQLYLIFQACLPTKSVFLKIFLFFSIFSIDKFHFVR